MSNVLIRGTCIAAIGLVASWLLQSDHAPIYDWLLFHPTLTNAAATVNLPAFFAAALGYGNIHAPSDAWYIGALIVQWLLYGFAITWLWGKLWPNNSSKPTQLRGAA